MPVSKVYFSVPPINDQSVSSAANAFSGGFSNVKGNANIKFQISAQDRLLDTSDLYLTGRILHVRADGSPLTLKPAAATTLAEFNASQGNTLQAYTNQNVSNWGGVQNMVKRIFVQSKKTSVSISEHRNYPMFVNVKEAWSNADADYLISPLTRFDAAGNFADEVNRHSSLMDNQDTAAGAGQMGNVATQNDNAYGKPFSFKLDTALLNNSKPLHLGNSYLGGIIINLELNNENQFYYNRYEDQSNGADLDVAGSYFIVKDLKLTGRLLVPTPADLQAYNPNMLLGDRFNLINDVNSSTNSAKYTPNAAAVRSIVNLYLDQDQENSRSQNGSNFRIPLGLTEYTQQKNNVRQPQDFVVEVQPNQLTKTSRKGQVIDPITVEPKIGLVGDSEVRAFFQRSVNPRGELSGKCSVGLRAQEASIDAQYDATRGATAATEGCGDNTQANAMGIGLSYSHDMGMVSDFRQRDYDQIVKSGVNSGDAGLPASRSSKAEIIQTYINNISAFNTQTLMKSV